MAEVRGREHSRVGTLFGSPFRVEARSSTEQSVTDEELEDALASLPDLTGVHGNGSVRKGRLRWGSDGYEAQRSGYDFSIDAWEDGGRTEVSVRSRLRGAAGGIFGGIVGGLGFGMGSSLCFGLGMAGLHSPMLALLFGLGSVAGSWFLARGIFIMLARKARRAVERVATELARQLGSQ